MRTIALTVFALLAFAGNSVLCRLALADETIDPGSFTVIRLISGALLLAIIWYARTSPHRLLEQGSWRAGMALFVYALCFSYSYVELTTGVGALVLFGVVQVTMVMTSVFQGKKLIAIEWLGIILAMSGLSYLLWPMDGQFALDREGLEGFTLMAISGIAWGMYTLFGKGSRDPLGDTCCNFIRTVPMAIALLLITYIQFSLNWYGVVLAIASGAITSGLGYAIWYAVLPQLRITQAAVLQLLVPVIAAFGGVIFAAEAITQTLVVSSVLVLGGILMVVLSKNKSQD